MYESEPGERSGGSSILKELSDEKLAVDIEDAIRLNVAAMAVQVFIGGVEEGPAFRTNLGLCEVWGEEVTVRVAILDDAMIELGHRDYDLRPYENIQVNQVVPVLLRGEAVAKLCRCLGQVFVKQ